MAVAFDRESAPAVYEDLYDEGHFIGGCRLNAASVDGLGLFLVPDLEPIVVINMMESIRKLRG
ncbi:hypothetical protein MY10362_009867 [Beauveria mimosiformis]